ncbi:MAG: GNAT family N-acetyltransferase [Gammaproteobacteria bacterium]|nr:GNAT family N-acetyltransferase [Gammaproteobacteria bacterium]
MYQQQTEATGVSSRVRIRPAVKEDLEAITRLRKQAILESPQQDEPREHLIQWGAVLSEERTLRRIAEQCLLVAETSGEVISCNCLDLDEGEMVGPVVKEGHRGQGLGKRMVTEIERLAVQYGMRELITEAAQPRIGFFNACGYQVRPGASHEPDPRTRILSIRMSRRFPRRQTRYGARIRRLLEQIGIPPDYGRERRLKLQAECQQLATIGTDLRGREQLMQPKAAMAWYEMRNAALSDGIELNVASAFRSVGYQVTIIERKKQAGQDMDEILKVSAAPGYSEHHTGRAIDICCPSMPPLEECFENTEAFEWLTDSAHRFGFSMSYPRNNIHRIAYEPWHWAWRNSS